MLFPCKDMAFNLKQGSSLLDDENDMSSVYIENGVPDGGNKDGGNSSDECYEDDDDEEEAVEKGKPRVVKNGEAVAAVSDDGTDSDNSVDDDNFGEAEEEEAEGEDNQATAESLLTPPSCDGIRKAEAVQQLSPVHPLIPSHRPAPVVIEKTETEKEMIDNKVTMFLLRPLEKPQQREEDNIVEVSPEMVFERKAEASTSVVVPSSLSPNPIVTSVIEDSRVNDDEEREEEEGEERDDDDFFASLVSQKDGSKEERKEEKTSGIEIKKQTTDSAAVEPVEQEKEKEDVEIYEPSVVNDEMVKEKEDEESTRIETVVKLVEDYDEFANQEPPLHPQSKNVVAEDNFIYSSKDSNPPVTFIGAVTASPAELITPLPFQPTFPVSPPNAVLPIPPLYKTSFPEPSPAFFKKRPRSNSLDSKYSNSYCHYGVLVKRQRTLGHQLDDDDATAAAEDTRLKLPSSLPSQVSKQQEPAKNSLFNDATRVSKTLLSREIKKSLIDNVRKESLVIRARMLREQTEGLNSRQLVNILFGENDEDVKLPSKEERRILKKLIDMELTVKRFTEYSKVFDYNSAELFRKDNETLEHICRQQIMSNPLLSAIDSASSIIPDDAPLNTQYGYYPQSSALSEDVAEEEVDTIIKQQERVCPSNSTTQAMLHKDLCDILNNAEGGDPANRLASRLSFLKRTLSYKIGNMTTISKMVNLMKFILKQSVDMIKRKSRVQEKASYISAAPFVEPMNAIEEFGLSGISVDFLFGTISKSVTNAIIRTCSSVSELSIFLGVPMVLLQWPQEFTSSMEYKALLTKSIFSFNAKTNTSITFILDELLKDEEEVFSPSKSTGCSNKTPTFNADELMTEQQKAAIIRDAFHSERYRDCAYGMFNLVGSRGGSPPLAVSRPLTVGPSLSVVYQNAMNIIDGRIRIVDSLFESVVDFVDTHKISIARLLNRVVSSAGVAATVYLMNRSIKKTNAKKKKKDNNKDPSTKTGSNFSQKQKESGLRAMMPYLTAPSASKNAVAVRYESDSDDNTWENLAYKQWRELQ